MTLVLSLIHIFIADNCTDDTAQVARGAGAIVYERFNKVQVGKGYALDWLFKIIDRDLSLIHIYLSEVHWRMPSKDLKNA